MWYKINQDKIEIKILAKPNAKKSHLLRVTDQGLHISLHAKPHQGEANKELIIFISELFNIPKSKIELKRGESSRIKTIVVPICDEVKKLIDASK